MKLVLITPTVRAIRDEQTHQWSLIDLFNSITISKGAKFAMQNFFVMAILRGVAKPGNHNASIKLYDPDGSEIASADFSGEMEYEETNYAGYFALVRFEKVGRHVFHLILDGKQIKDDDQYYIDVIKEV